MKKLKRIHSILCQFGINLLKFKNIIYIPLFFKSFFKYKSLININENVVRTQIDYIFPILGDHKVNQVI